MLQARSGILFRWRDAHGLGFQTALSETGSRTRWEAAGWIRSGGPPLTRAAAGRSLWVTPLPAGAENGL